MNATCGWSILNKQPIEAFQLLNDMVEESREDAHSLGKIAPEISVKMQDKSKLDDLCALVQQMMEMLKLTIKEKVKACQLCYTNTHMMDECPSIQTEEEINTLGHTYNLGGGQCQRQRFDPYS